MVCYPSISKIKVGVSLDGVLVQNALTFTPGLLEFGGPLVHNTLVTGGYAMSWGDESSRLNQFNVKTQNQILLSHHNGISESLIRLTNSGIELDDNIANKGLVGIADYSANYTNTTFIQKIYADTRILGKPVSETLQTPTPDENGYAIIWNHGDQIFELSPMGSVSAGADTQVIFNSAGVLVGSNQFTYSSNTLSVEGINLGVSSIGGTDRTIQSISNVPDTGIIIKTKGAGNLQLNIDTGKVIIGSATSANLIHSIQTRGSNAQINIALEPKGSEGIVYIGSDLEVGGYRYVVTRGSAANINLFLGTKGTGSVIVDSTSVNPFYLGRVDSASNYRIIKAGSSILSDIAIGGNGVASKVLIGDNIEAASDRYIQANSFSANANLHILGKGTGLVAVNNVVNYKKIPIGDWNMNSFLDTTVAHGLPDYKKIVSVRAVIRDDTDSTYTPLDCMDNSGTGTIEGGISSWNGSTIFLQRRNSGFFDQTTHQATGFNRGWIYISYEL